MSAKRGDNCHADKRACPRNGSPILRSNRAVFWSRQYFNVKAHLEIRAMPMFGAGVAAVYDITSPEVVRPRSKFLILSS